MSPLHEGPGQRLWRVRRQFDQMDAILVSHGDRWLLRYTLNGDDVMSREFADDSSAIDEAGERLKELQRVGWYTHW